MNTSFSVNGASTVTLPEMVTLPFSHVVCVSIVQSPLRVIEPRLLVLSGQPVFASTVIREGRARRRKIAINATETTLPRLGDFLFIAHPALAAAPS